MSQNILKTWLDEVWLSFLLHTMQFIFCLFRTSASDSFFHSFPPYPSFSLSLTLAASKLLLETVYIFQHSSPGQDEWHEKSEKKAERVRIEERDLEVRRKILGIGNTFILDTQEMTDPSPGEMTCCMSKAKSIQCISMSWNLSGAPSNSH